MKKYKSFEQQFNINNCLFRYRTIDDNNISALENNKLYFSTPNNFNDPYDNLIFASLKKIFSDVMGNIYSGMDDYLEKLKSENPEAAFYGHKYWNGSNRDGTIDIFFKQICVAVDLIKKSVRNNVKIICFSEVYNSMLMWSHYADNHKGFLLVYEKADIKNAKRCMENDVTIERKIHLDKVEYVTEQIDLSEDIEEYVRNNMMPNMGDVVLDERNIPQYKLRKLMLQKSHEWAYEKEWRLIPRTIDLQVQCPLEYISCIPSAIILGARCSNINTEKMINIAKKNRIPIFRMYLSEFEPTFELQVGDGRNTNLI